MKALRGALALAVLAGVGSYAMAQVTGKVTLEGAAPEMGVIDMSAVAECASQHPDPVLEQTVVAGENGELANVIVAISPDTEVAGEVPSEPAVIDQQACMYHPHVLAVMVGQKMQIKNSDPFLHNVHALSEANPPFNFGQPNIDPGKDVDPPKVAEYYHVKCDVHPWMSAYVGVFPHPYFAVTKEDGTFSIANVPDGDYTFTAWHEKYGTQEQTATVKDGKAELTFKFNAESAQANPAPMVHEVKLVSDETKCEDKESCCGMKTLSTVKAEPQKPQAKPEQPQAKAE
jgi:plastocyanin